jgi:hypothetical protein
MGSLRAPKKWERVDDSFLFILTIFQLIRVIFVPLGGKLKDYENDLIIAN